MTRAQQIQLRCTCQQYTRSEAVFTPQNQDDIRLVSGLASYTAFMVRGGVMAERTPSFNHLNMHEVKYFHRSIILHNAYLLFSINTCTASRNIAE